MRLTSPRWAPAKRSLDALIGDHKDTRRIQVTNPSLCNDTINLLRSNLPKPASCDIIDINPGACVWTKSLHEALKPRRHVLVEPSRSKYVSIIDSLTSEPGSKYHKVASITEALELSSLSDAFQTHYQGLDEQQRNTIRRQPTDELIITANLSGKKAATTRFKGPPWRLFFDQFYRSISLNQGVYDFNKYGLVRLLAWIPEGEKDKIIPKSVLRRSRINKKLEAACDVREVVSNVIYGKTDTLPQPWYGVVVKSRDRALASQDHNNLHIPPYRQHPMPAPSLRFYEPTMGNLDKYEEKLETNPKRSRLVRSFVDLWHAMEVEDKQWLEDHVSLKSEGRQRKPGHIPEKQIYRDFCFAYTRMRLHHNKYKEAEELIDDLVALEQKLVSFRRQHPENYEGYLSLLEKIKPELDSLHAKRTDAYRDTRIEVLKAVDDYRALYNDPPVLAWQKRPHEPLLSHPKEDFKPSREPLCLIEVVPKPAFVNAINTSDRQVIFDHICNSFDTVPTRLTSLKKGIESLVGEGELYEAFIQTMPSLTDPLHGGWHDLNDVRTRNISVETLIQLTLAYEAWPYRISVEKMMEKAMGLGSGFLTKGVLH